LLRRTYSIGNAEVIAVERPSRVGGGKGRGNFRTVTIQLAKASQRTKSSSARHRKTDRSVITGGKIGAVVETTSTIEPEVSGYCRSKVPYPEQIRRRKEACLQGTQSTGKQRQREAKRDKQRIKHSNGISDARRRTWLKGQRIGAARKAGCPLGGQRGRVTSYPKRRNCWDGSTKQWDRVPESSGNSPEKQLRSKVEFSQ